MQKRKRNKVTRVGETISHTSGASWLRRTWSNPAYRFVALILVGRYWYSTFEFMHLYFWQVTLILMITSVWEFWIEWGRTVYLKLFVTVAEPAFLFIGVNELKPQLVIDHFINYVPFIVLMVITPKLSVKRRVVGIAAGIVMLFIGHIGLMSLAYAATSNYGLTQKAFSVLFPGFLVNDSLPFILWAIIASGWLKEVIASARKSRTRDL